MEIGKEERRNRKESRDDNKKSQPKQNYAVKYQARNANGRTLSEKEIATYGCCILEVL